jgi:hypothetical protein
MTDRQMLQKLVEHAMGYGCGCLMVQPLLCCACSERLNKTAGEAYEHLRTSEQEIGTMERAQSG